MTEKNSVSGLAIWQLKNSLKDGRCDPKSRKLLCKALKPLGDMLEEMSPAVLQPTPDGVLIGYGPSLNGHHVSSERHLFLVASSNGHAAAMLLGWPNIDTARAEVEKGMMELYSEEARPMLESNPREKLWAIAEWRASVWAVISRALRQKDPSVHIGAGVALVAIIGEAGKRQIIESSNSIRQKQLLPAVCALVGVKPKGQGATGSCGVIVLPPAIDLRLAETHQQH